MASSFFNGLQACSWQMIFRLPSEVCVCVCALWLTGMREVVVPSLFPSEEWFLSSRTKIYIGFLHFIPCSACWFLQGCIRIALGLESKGLGRQSTQLSHFWFRKNTAGLDLLKRRLWGKQERTSALQTQELDANVGYFYCWLWLKSSYTIGSFPLWHFEETLSGCPYAPLCVGQHLGKTSPSRHCAKCFIYFIHH